MKNNQNLELVKYIFLGVILYLLFLVIKPYLSVLVISALFTIIFYPIHKYLNNKLKFNPTISAFATIIISILFFVIPIAIFLTLLINEAYIFSKTLNQNSITSVINSIKSNSIFGFDIEPYANQALESLKSISANLASKSSQILSKTLNSLNNLLIFILLYFYLLIDSKKITTVIQKNLPYNKKEQKQIFDTISRISKTILYGNLTLALASGFIAFFACTLFSIKAAILWSFFAGILAFIPTIGTLLLYLTFAIFIFFNNGILASILLIIYYITAELIMKDEFIKPKLIDEKLNLHPILIFFGLIGGITTFGSIGIIYGPLIISLFIILYNIKFQQTNNSE